MRHNIKSFLRNDESGAAAVEYALLTAGISVAIIAVVNTLGTRLNGIFTGLTSAMGGGGGV